MPFRSAPPPGRRALWPAVRRSRTRFEQVRHAAGRLANHAGTRGRRGARPRRRSPPRDRPSHSPAVTAFRTAPWEGADLGVEMPSREDESAGVKRVDYGGHLRQIEEQRPGRHQRRLETVPGDPSCEEYRQGKTMGPAYRHWRRAKIGRRFRLFFRYDSRAKEARTEWAP